MERTGTSRSCPSGPARQVAGRHVVGQPDAVGGLVEGVAGRVHGRGVHRQDDLGEGHPLLGRRIPDLDLVTADGPLRVFTLLHDARPVLLNLGVPGGFDITPWADRVQSIDARYVGTWEPPVLGPVTAPTAVLIRPDGYVAWVGDRTPLGLPDALTTWFGPPAAA
jgi:3-(3-hydroxy-phenyl)propionate hydroxylase